MIFRIAFFISLVALFYYYCQDGGAENQRRESNDINMIEVPVESSPVMQNESGPEALINSDSSIYFFSTRPPASELSTVFSISVPHNF